MKKRFTITKLKLKLLSIINSKLSDNVRMLVVHPHDKTADELMFPCFVVDVAQRL